MANLTITVDDDVLRRARARAARRGASINALLSDYLRHYAGADASAQAIHDFLELAASADARSGAAGRTWTRDELHDRTNLR
jgi:plasmid stability protein